MIGRQIWLNGRSSGLGTSKNRLPSPDRRDTIEMRYGDGILLDRTSIEVYANAGRVYMPRRILPKDNNRSLSASTAKGEVKASFLRVHELKSAWE